MATRVPSATKLWTYTKIWTAVKDVPENAVLGFMVASTLSVSAYAMYRTYFLLGPTETIPDKASRADWTLQVAHAHEPPPESIFRKIARWKVDKDGADIGVGWFSNRVFPHEYEMPVRHPHPTTTTNTGVPSEGPYPSEY